MNTTPPQRPLDRYFAGYAEYYRHPLNQAIGGVAVPAMAWSAVALLWCIPVFGTLAKTGIWAALAMFFAWSYYYRLSRPLGLGMLMVFFVYGCLCRLLEMRLGLVMLLWTALAVLVLAWAGQFIGHRLEGRKPGLFTDRVYLLIGPLWVLARLYRRIGWKY